MILQVLGISFEGDYTCVFPFSLCVSPYLVLVLCLLLVCRHISPCSCVYFCASSQSLGSPQGQVEEDWAFVALFFCHGHS